MTMIQSVADAVPQVRQVSPPTEQSTLDLLTAGPKFSRPASHTHPTMRIARRCTVLPLPRALPTGRTDGQTPHRFNTLTAYAVRVYNKLLQVKKNSRVILTMRSSI